MRKLVILAFALLLLSSCQVAYNIGEDNFLSNHVGTHSTYTCDWIDDIKKIEDIQGAIYDHVTYKLGGNGHYTQSPEETCKLRTGNCADKSVLMISILYTNFAIKGNLVCAKYDNCHSVVDGGDIDHAIVEVDSLYYESTSNIGTTYTDVDICYRYTFDELFPNVLD